MAYCFLLLGFSSRKPGVRKTIKKAEALAGAAIVAVRNRRNKQEIHLKN